MSLSRLPQVALRRLVPAITAVPKSLDDDQLKKMMEQQQQQQHHALLQHQPPGATLKTLLAGRSEMPAFAPPQSVTAALAKPQQPAADSVPAALGRLLVTLGSGSNGCQGKLSPQDLALIAAATATAVREIQHDSPSLLTTPEPGSPVAGALTADLEPAEGMLDSATMDALVSALRGTVAVSTDNSGARAAPEPSAYRPPTRSSSRGSVASAAEADDAASDDELAPIPANLSAAERRKEQNRRAQKKFRQKDKVRQKEIKWRAAQYESLVESNKRFKRDIDDIAHERDMYRRMLESHGIAVDGSSSAGAAAPPLLGPARTPASTATASPLSPAASFGGMDQLAQDTFGTMPAAPFAQATATMGDLLAPLMFGAVKSDPMFGAATSQPLATAVPATADAGIQWLEPLRADPLLVEPPLVVDHASIDPHYAHQTTLDAQFVDPLSFIDELLASPDFSTSSPSLP
ncbi:hypothetical protein IWQ57_004823, partial [Coemansia nantahalensis]